MQIFPIIFSYRSITASYPKHLIHFELTVFNVAHSKGPVTFFCMSMLFYHHLVNRLLLPWCFSLASLSTINCHICMGSFLGSFFFFFLLLKIIHITYSNSNSYNSLMVDASTAPPRFPLTFPSVRVHTFSVSCQKTNKYIKNNNKIR